MRYFAGRIKEDCREEGAALVLFAFCITILLFFTALAVDVGILNMKRGNMMNLCQEMRKARLDAVDYILNSDDPARMIYDISNRCAVENGFSGKLKVYYQETTNPSVPTSNWVDGRTYKVRIELTQSHRYIFFPAVFAGASEKAVSVVLDGSEEKTSGGEGFAERVPVWCPSVSPAYRSGSYERSDLTGAAPPKAFQRGDIPAEW